MLRCAKCKLSFCEWHLLFLDDGEEKATCVCCFFGIKRTKKFRDPALPDPLAVALKEHASTGFRDRLFKAKIEYERAEEYAFGPNGPEYFHPGMAPPMPDDIKQFIKSYQR